MKLLCAAYLRRISGLEMLDCTYSHEIRVEDTLPVIVIDLFQDPIGAFSSIFETGELFSGLFIGAKSKERCEL